MHQLQNPIAGDDESWRQRCNERMETLKAREFPSSEEPSSQPIILQEEIFGVKNSEILELQKAVEIGNVERFVDMLEQLSSEKKLPLSAIFDQVTCTGDSLLHVAACFGKAEIAELIGHHFSKLLTKKNITGDIPLHVAARERRVGVIKLILSQYAAYKSTSLRENNNDEEITRMANEYGNTALHEAVCSKHFEGVALLFEEDKCVAHYLNKHKTSPLYLAALASNKKVVNVLLDAPFPANKPLPKSLGNSPLHAVIRTRYEDLLKEILDKRPNLIYLRDEEGGTPLHYAARIGYVDGVRVLLKEYTLTALEWNTKGQFPIHLACKWGHIGVLKEFLKPEWADSRVLCNRKGQSILHIAANNGKIFVVKYLLRYVPFILNLKDKNGNTPLHLAANNSFPHVLFHLTQAKSIDLNIKNNEGFTALDIVGLGVETEVLTTRQYLSYFILCAAGGEISEKATSIFRKRRFTQKRELINERTNTLMVVAALIVTVTFAAGFTLPGGVYGSESKPHERGMAVLSKRTMFKVFVVMDTVAMYSSVFGCFALLWAQLPDFAGAVLSSNMALLMVGVALLAMNVAFIAGVSLVVSNVPGLASFIIIIGIISSFFISSFFTIVLFLRFVLMMPRQIGNLVLRTYILGYEILVPTYKDKVKKLQSPASQAE